MKVRDDELVTAALAGDTAAFAAGGTVPADSAQDAADALIGAGVKIVFNHSEALLDVPSDVSVHTSNPAVALLYALYFHLT